MIQTSIQCTTDYEVFKTYGLQRDIKHYQFLRLVESMKRFGFKHTHPIVINSNFEVVDGQHRLAAARHLGICVYFIEDNETNIDLVRVMASTQKRWDVDDYITSYIRQGNENYKRLKELKEATNMNWEAMLTASFPTSGYSPRYQKDLVTTGKFIMTDEMEAHARKFLAAMKDFDFFPYWNSEKFAQAFGYIFRHGGYDHENMKRKLGQIPTRIIRCASTKEYIEMLSNTYNWKNLSKNWIIFSERENSAQRRHSRYEENKG